MQHHQQVRAIEELPAGLDLPPLLDETGAVG
jgi:hypothetical protein